MDQVIAKYSKLEQVSHASEIRHPIIREALALTGIETRIEIASMSTSQPEPGWGVPAASLPRCSAGCIRSRRRHSPHALAEQACHIEIDRLGEPIGKQDQFIAAYGGLTTFRFAKDGQVTVKPLKMEPEALANLEDNLCLFFTGYTRDAGAILKDQDQRSRSHSSGHDR